ncbi:MAG: zinc-ribbon domain-containing protein [Rhodocyclaceae bacterium]|jgi:predicted Zn finger-like uncharacterized protein|nr:zinc-ribbon domain-containing protein [Rhodocyclaceae bacterium]MCA3141756.1 zinc-ribbon domain-containing protein [Rhodocyclaceae bacterium]
MTMFTRCASCGAAFRVTLDQLQASAGQVRCGVCETVFDAFVSLTASDPRGDALPGLTAAPAGPTTGRQEQAPPPQEAQAGARRGSTSPAAAHDGGGRGARAPQTAAPASQPVIASDRSAMAVRRGGGWSAVLVFLLAGAALAQATYFLRAEVAARAPALRPWLERACRPLGCAVPMPRETERLSIEGSDLRALDPARPGRVLLTATIRNHAPFAQAWPLLELTLTNVRDEAVIRRAFTATEYLAPAAPGAGIGPGAEATVRMRLEAQDLQPVGYRLYLFQP